MITRMFSMITLIVKIKRLLSQALLIYMIITANAAADRLPLHEPPIDGGDSMIAPFLMPAPFFCRTATFHLNKNQPGWQPVWPHTPSHNKSPMFVWRRALQPLCAESSASEPTNAQASPLPIFGIDPDFQAMLPRLRKIFICEGIPSELVWLAEVESRFNTRAISAAGATGLFQLMPATAQRFGLRTGVIDDRIVPERNATAAARYLKMLHRQFGCWTLAMAAYNAGEGRVARLLQQHAADNFNDIAAFLPRETRRFVPKVMTIVALREDQMHNAPGSFWMPSQRRN